MLTVELYELACCSQNFALYFLDWDNSGRTETVTVLDGESLTILDTRTVSDFVYGKYLVWQVGGHLIFQITPAAGPNAVVSGIFLGQ
jgi:hypothetical protein